jgi:hypothetical protein
MGDSILNFSDLGTDSYTGLSDTGSGYSGSSTFQDVQLGSPLVLDTGYGESTAAVTDFVGVSPITSDVTNGLLPLPAGSATAAQVLSGSSDPGFAPVSNSDIYNLPGLTNPATELPSQNPQASPTPAAAPPNNSSATALTALSKFGASFAQLMGGAPKTTAAAQNINVTTGGAALPPASTTTTLILVIVVAAVILLLVKGE